MEQYPHYPILSLRFMPHTRDDYCSMRKIVLTEYIVEGEHWLRFRHIGEKTYSGVSEYNGHSFDYIEFVPLHIVSDPIKPEDRH